MHPRTRATLDELDRAEWFAAVGRPVEGPFVMVSSWDEATASCASPEWDALLLEAGNRYAEAVAKRSLERFNAWNEIAAEVRALTVPFVERKTRDVVARHALPGVFVDTVQWDILHVCMEAEYADVYPPGFFASQAYWYVNGHFPCGWKGPFPEGRLVLY
jgi:hypothetical protein